MRTAFVVAALGSLVAAQDFAVSEVAAAPPVAETAPPTTAATSTFTYAVNTPAASASISSKYSTAANAEATGTVQKRTFWWPQPKPQPQNFCFWPWWQCPPAPAPKPPTPAPKPPTPAPAPHPPAPVPGPPASPTWTTSTTSSTTSSSTACPTTPEEGTYCGFINPLDPCSPQPSSTGAPKVKPDTPEAFKNSPIFHAEAKSAVTPAGYQRVFQDLDGSVEGSSYLTYKLLNSYAVSECSQYCDDTKLCTAFNIYVERGPSQNPSTNASTAPTVWGRDCPNPPSQTLYKCSLWGSSITAAMATNKGQKREEFQVVIAGSNGYDKSATTTPPPCTGYQPPKTCHGKGVNKNPKHCLGSGFFSGPFDPSICAIYAKAQAAKNKELALQGGLKHYTPCNLFNAYYVFKNGIAHGTYCSLFNTEFDGESFADFSGTNEGGFEWSVGSSWTYSVQQHDDGDL